MAVANVSMLESSFLGENHSPVSRRWGDQVRSTNRTSSILQMWRELERERMSSCPLRNDESNDHFESPYVSEGPLRSDVSNVSHMENCARSQWLGENECERVRIVREWIEMTTQQRNTCRDPRQPQDTEIGTQIERVRDGLGVNCHELGARRTIRRLCGRQALLDLVARSERERKRELQNLSEKRPVSDFAHRNRIQSLLKGRFLRNGTLVQDKRPTSLAASELGLLRQRHTVSGLREGFLSRLDNYAHSPPAQSDTSFNSELIDHQDEETQANNLQDIPDEISDKFEDTNTESDLGGFHTDDLESNEIGDTRLQEFMAPVDGRQEQLLENEEREQLPSSVELIEGRGPRGHDAEDTVINGWSQDKLVAEGQAALAQVHEISHEHYEPSRDEREVDQVSGIIDSLQTNAVEDLNWQEGSAQVEELLESVTENEENDWHQLARVEFGEVMDEYSHDSSHGWYQEIEVNDLQDLHEEWHENDLEETTENWLDGLSHHEVAPVGMTDAFYSSDNDNGHNLELRELLSRRRVSNLLQSGFRESLDQLIQSYVERQGHASDNWELDRMSSSPGSREQPGEGHELQNGDENYGDREAAEGTELVLPSLPFTHPETSWDQDLHGAANWQRSSIHQRLGIEWDIINDLRIDMVRLQQRMNNMQRMLEACMDMQLELQCSVRQEVSAALNRSSPGSAEACEDSLLKEEAKWSQVRQGTCCLCCENNIDSLLYRCGHMCTCSKCAEKLVESREKCPMCHAPVLEVIRAYPIN